MKNLEEDIIYRSGYWYLDSLGLGQFTNGLTNNASETYNSMIRHLKPKGSTRQTADITAIRLFSFETCLHNFVLACYFGRGEFLHCIIQLAHLYYGFIKDLQIKAILDTSHGHCYLTLIVHSQYLMVRFKPDLHWGVVNGFEGYVSQIAWFFVNQFSCWGYT